MSPHVIDDISGNLTVETEPILKVVLERRGSWHKGKIRVRTLGNLQSLWQSQVLTDEEIGPESIFSRLLNKAMHSFPDLFS